MMRRVVGQRPRGLPGNHPWAAARWLRGRMMLRFEEREADTSLSKAKASVHVQRALAEWRERGLEVKGLASYFRDILPSFVGCP